MTTCSLDFVDSIAATPTVRLNLSDSVTWILNANETDFSPPPLRQAIAQTLLTDGGVVPSSAYDFRRITLGLFLAEATADDMAAALQSLYRELDRPGGNILRWHDHTTHPVFFRTHRASANSVRQLGRDGRRKKIEVELLAEPFGYGLRQDPVVAATVSTDPAAGSNGCFVDVTGVKGDVETPVLIRWPGTSNHQTLFTTRRRGDPSAAPFPIQAESMTQVTDTTVQANDTNFSGAGSNYSRCTFATNATMQNRLTVSPVGTSGIDLRGRYRAFLRYRKNTGPDSINLQLRWGDDTATVVINNDAFATFSNTSFQFADLGLISIPMGVDPVTDSNGVERAVSNLMFLAVRAERTSGSGSIDFDHLLLVPADDRLAICTWQKTDSYLLDATDTSAFVIDGSDRVVGVAAPFITGGLPMLTPNQSNRVYMIRTVNGNGVANSLTTVSPVAVSYLPRYLTVRPAST